MTNPRVQPVIDKIEENAERRKGLFAQLGDLRSAGTAGARPVAGRTVQDRPRPAV